MSVGGNSASSNNPHNRHMLQAWAPRSCVEEYHHLVFTTASAAVKDALRKWDRKLQEKRAALARRRNAALAAAVALGGTLTGGGTVGRYRGRSGSRGGGA